MKLFSHTNPKAPLTMHSCAICNAVFICLDIYQQHRKDHAKKEGVELHACNHCSYATDNAFHFNWHAMSHASEDRHQCDYCRHQRRNEEDKSWSSASKESDFDESMLPGRISESSVSFGKRSIATQSSSDDLYPPSPPLPHQQYIPPKTIHNTGNIYQNLEHIENNQLNGDEFEEDDGETDEVGEAYDDDEPHHLNAEDEINNDDNETEEESSINECDNVNGSSAYYPEGEVLQQQQQSQQFKQQSFYQDSGQINGEYEQLEDEDDGTIEDEEAQELIQQEEEQHQEYQEYENNEQYENEGADDDDEEDEEDNTYEGVEGDANVTEENNIERKGADVYDFNSDEEAQTPQFQIQQQPQQATLLSNGTAMPGPMPAQLQPHPSELHTSIVTAPNGSTHLQLQPAFVHHPHPHSHPHQTGLPPLQPAPPPPHHHHPPPVQANQATFQLGPHLTNQHPHQHHQPTFITLPNGASGFTAMPAHPASGNYFQFEGANGQIRLVSIPAAFNPAQQTPQQQQQHHSQQIQQQLHHQHQSSLQVPQPLPTAQPQAIQPAPMQQLAPQNVQQAQPSTQDGQTNATPARRRSKKNTNDIVELNGTPSNGDIITSINQPFVPTKGKGKGNRKPRINFISVINGITVGADGIRRKFHCSHCGNGKSFKTKSHLQRHMLTHTGEKPYQCNECGSKFNQSSSLRNHIIAIHTKKFPHTCTVCGKGFLMPAVLAKHIQQTNHCSEGNEAVGSTGTCSIGSPGTTQDTNSKDENHYDENQHNDDSMYVYGN